jgi:hypothetical protein
MSHNGRPNQTRTWIRAVSAVERPVTSRLLPLCRWCELAGVTTRPDLNFYLGMVIETSFFLDRDTGEILFDFEYEDADRCCVLVSLASLCSPHGNHHDLRARVAAVLSVLSPLRALPLSPTGCPGSSRTMTSSVRKTTRSGDGPLDAAERHS